jgi:transposase-like protein
MPVQCVRCQSEGRVSSNFVRDGFFYRTSDSTKVQRFRCALCRARFSRATSHSCFRQKKRQKNELLRRLLCSGVSLRRSAIILRLTRVTVSRKLFFLSRMAKIQLHARHSRLPLAQVVEFDDLETFEHSIAKPLSVTLAVESGSRRILAIAVSSMPLRPSRAHLYPRRPDQRSLGRKSLLKELMSLTSPKNLVIKSDSNPHYTNDIGQHFPYAIHKRFLGKRGALTGQGELKKLRFDPLFSLNHTCAMLRANINRLFRKTWCTTKRKDRLLAHLLIYANYHNQNLTQPL